MPVMKAQAPEPELRFYMDLCPAPDEDVEEQAFQGELKKLFHDLRAQGVEVAPSYYVVDTVYGGGGLSGEFFLPAVKTITASVLATLGVFFQSRNGRKVRIKIGDVDAEAQNAEEVKELLKVTAKYLKDAAGAAAK